MASPTTSRTSLIIILVYLIFPVDSQLEDRFHDDPNQVLGTTMLSDTKGFDNSQTLTVTDSLEENSTTTTLNGIRDWPNNNTFNTVAFETDFTTPRTSGPSCDRSFCYDNGDCWPLSPPDENRTDSLVFSCFCDHGYVGVRCRTRDLCLFADADQPLNEHDVCNGGACVYTEDMTERHCTCFEGEFWDQQLNKCREAKPPCFPNPCYNDGACQVTSPNDFNCSCAKGFTGPDCRYRYLCGDDSHLQTEIGSCGGRSNACKLDELKKMYYCDCGRDRYFDPEMLSCIAIDPPCLPNPCNGHGSCSITEDGYANCSCHAPYIGRLCQTKDLCTSDVNGTICPNGGCKISSDGTIQFCDCDNGYFLDEYTGSCKEIQLPCVPNPCSNLGMCQAITDEDFNCTCAKGFFGDHCQFRDRCVLDGGHAFCKEANCIVNVQTDTFSCRCPDTGEYFDYRKRKCQVLDYCPLMSCDRNQMCKNSSCVCVDGFEWSEEAQECKADFCARRGCPSVDMACQESSSLETPEDISCMCKEGHSFNGEQCVLVSCIFPQLNNCSQFCYEGEKGPSCGCRPGFFIDVIDNSTCHLDDNQTTSFDCLNSTCNPGICVQQDNSSRTTCFCRPGYIKRDGKCVDLCSAGQLPPGICPDDRCVSNEEDGGFKCSCDGKYQQSEDGITCSPRNMCAIGEIGWSSCLRIGATCIEEWTSFDGYKCECLPGTQMLQTGKCEEICENPVNQVKCSKLGAVCGIDASGQRVECRCPPGFSNSSGGMEGPCTTLARFSYITHLPISVHRYGRSKRSSNAIDVDLDGLEMDVFTSMKRLFETFTSANLLKCQSVSKDTMLCKIELQFTRIQEKDLTRIHSSLIHNETFSHDSVLLPPSLVLVKKDAKSPEINFGKTSHCDEDIKLELCGSEMLCHEYDQGESSPRRFTCTCSMGFREFRRTYPVDDHGTYIDVCRDIDECSESSVCSDNSLCTNTLGSYQCSCLDGYRRVERPEDGGGATCVELCNPNPCTHGDCTPFGENSFQCTCEAGFGGSLCDFEDKNFKAAKVRTIIVGAVLGGILLIAVILFTATVSRMRKKKQLAEPMLYGTEMIEIERRLAAANAGYERD